LSDRLLDIHHEAFGTSGVSKLDLHAVQGVQYIPVISAKTDLDEAALGQFVGRYVLTEIPEAVAGQLPAEVRIEIRDGKLFGVDSEMGCISLVPIMPTRFAMPDNPALNIEFYMDGDTVEKLTVEAGPISAVYEQKE
jgi:hypothetical protein